MYAKYLRGELSWGVNVLPKTGGGIVWGELSGVELSVLHLWMHVIASLIQILVRQTKLGMCVVFNKSMVLDGVVATILKCRSRNWCSYPYQGRNFIRDFCSISTPRQLIYKECTATKLLV